MLTSLKRIIRAGWIGFSRNNSQNVATVFIMVITVSFVSLLFLLNLTSHSLVESFKEKVDISVYFKENVLENDILEASFEISKISEVKKIEYVSKERALEKFIERHKDDPVLIESLAYVGGNPFLASLNIQAFEASQYESVSSFLEKASFEGLIDKIDYYQRKPLIERVSSLISGINKVGLISTLALIVLAILVAFSTTKLAIFNSKEEISVMRLVGASNRFIQGPFLVQGAIAGGIAFLVTLLLSSLSCYFLGPKLEFLFPGLNIWELFSSNFWILFLIQIFTGIGLGIVSSLIATRKYLKI